MGLPITQSARDYILVYQLHLYQLEIMYGFTYKSLRDYIMDLPITILVRDYI